MEKLKVVITLAERARSRGRDRGLERFDGDYGIAQREEKRKFLGLGSGGKKISGFVFKFVGWVCVYVC